MVQPPPTARAIRIIHAALVIGLVIVGATFYILLAVLGLRFGGTPLIAYVMVGVAVVNVTVALGVMLPQMAQRSSDQSPDDYWSTDKARGISIMVWALIEGAGLLSLVAYLMTGMLVPAAAAIVSILALIVLRPSRLEG